MESLLSEFIFKEEIVTLLQKLLLEVVDKETAKETQFKSELEKNKQNRGTNRDYPRKNC